MTDVLVIGGGPAGLMAAEDISAAGHAVLVADQKPSLARKFLMAGKSGLNLTKDEPVEAFLNAYGEGRDWLSPMIAAFGPAEVRAWVEGLGQELFTGSTGRVFPHTMKASPLLRAWLRRLESQGVETRTRWRWRGWDGDAVTFETPQGDQRLTPKVMILACGGASWARLGSDGAWADWLPATPFKPSNVGLLVDWTDHMTPHFGKPLKAMGWRAGDLVSRGEAVLSARGLEGGGLYPLIPAVRDGAPLYADFAPDLTEAKLVERLPQSPRKGLTKILRNTMRFPPEKIAFFHECARDLAIPLTAAGLARCLKALPVHHRGPRPIDEAISTAGGVRRANLTDDLMLKSRPGTFVAGEMLDWDAPTGGYLLTACLATGRWAAQSALRYLAASAA